MIGINECLWVLLFLTNFGIIILIFRMWGKQGLFVWMGISVILANIQVTKTVELFGFVATLGNVIYASSFLITDILNEIYGKKEAKKAIWIGFYGIVAMTILMTIGLHFTPHESDFAQSSLSTIFGIMPRIILASLTAYLISNFNDVLTFDILKEKTKGKYLWLRNNVSTMISQAIDSIIFVVIAFYGVFENNILIQIFFTTYILKFVVAVGDTPFIYIAKYLYKKYNLK